MQGNGGQSGASAVSEMNHGKEHLPQFLTARDIARLLKCSVRTVYRLTDSGRMPRPVKLGAMVRWPREVIESWVAIGCPKAEGMEAVL